MENTEPVVPVPEDRTPVYNALDSLIITPSVILGATLSLLKFKFSDPDQIYNRGLRSCIYKKNKKDTKIHIRRNTELDESTVGVHPLIFVKPGTTKQTSPGVLPHNLNTLALDADGRFRGVTGVSYLSGSLDIGILADEDLQSLKIAEEIFLWLLMYQSRITEDLKISKFETTLLSGPVKLDTPQTTFKSAVNVEWSYEFTWRTDVSLPPIQTLTHNN